MANAAFLYCHRRGCPLASILRGIIVLLLTAGFLQNPLPGRGRVDGLSLRETGLRASPSLVPPTGVSATDGTLCGLVRVSWSQVTGATHYQVYRASSATGTKTAVSPWQAGTNFDDTTVSGGSAYYYWVKAATDDLGSGASDFSVSDGGYAAVTPSAPSGVAASDGTLVGVVRVTWNASTDAARYEVYRDGTKLGITANTQFDDVPGDSSVHQYVVKAWSVCGTGAASIPDAGNAGKASTVLDQLLPPTGVSAGEGTSSDKIAVSWNTVGGATSYKVYRATSPAGTKMEVSSWQPGNSYDDTTASAGVTYYYWVKAAADSTGARASDVSAPHAGRRALPPLTPPSGVAASDGTWIDKVRVTWDAVAGATNYQVYRAESEAGVKTAITPWQAMEAYDDATTTAGLTYYYWVKASADGNGGRASDFSATRKGRRALGALNPATGVSATDGTFCGLVRVSWTQVAGATKYQVYRASSATGTKTAVSPWQTANSYDDTTATPGSVYHYWVRASIDGGDEASSEYSLSDTGYVGMVPPAPTGVAASDGSFVNAVRITWNASPGATGYEVYRDGTLAGSSANSPYDDAPADLNTHVYIVKAKNACGTSTLNASDDGHVSCNCCEPSPLLTGATRGTSRNDYSGWAGMRFRVGSIPLVVRALGHIYANGNTQDHELRLVHAATNATVASVLWTATGGIDGQIHYATLAAPVTLAVDTEYYLASKESSGRDQSYGCSAVAAVTNAANAVSPIYSHSGDTWTTYGTSGNSTCGGVDLKYCVSSQQFLPPTGVVATNGSFSDKVRVTWNKVSGATSYQLYRAASAEGSRVAITPWQPGTTFDDSTTPAGSTVYYWVKAALDATGGQASDFSAAASGWRTTPSANPPAGVVASDGTLCRLVRVSWTPVAGATSYQVYRASSETGTKIAISPWQEATTYDDVKALASTSFYWVRAAMDGNGGGASDYSPPGRGLAGAGPIAPTGITASDGTYAGFVRVTWNPSRDVTGYDVYRDGMPVGGSPIPTYDDVPGDFAVHQYTVSARNGCGASAFGLPDTGNAGAFPPCAPIPLLTDAILGPPRNNYSGWVGIRFLVGINPLQVSALGRIYIGGNTQSHELRLVNAATGTTAARVLWMPAGGTHNQIKYAALPVPVILAANTEYYLVSQETAGGDMIYGGDTKISTTAAVGVLASASSDDGSMWWRFGASGSYGFGPLDLKYCESALAGQPQIGQAVPTPQRLVNNGDRQ